MSAKSENFTASSAVIKSLRLRSPDLSEDGEQPIVKLCAQLRLRLGRARLPPRRAGWAARGAPGPYSRVARAIMSGEVSTPTTGPPATRSAIRAVIRWPGISRRPGCDRAVQ